MELQNFIERFHGLEDLRTSVDRAVAILWFVGRVTPSTCLTARQIAGALEAGGYPSPNTSRLARQLNTDPRTARAGPRAFRLHPDGRENMEAVLAPILGSRPAHASDSVIPMQVVTASRRTYLVRVVHQANASYDLHLFDCCAVMLRRLVETLVIELFEHAGLAERILSPQGQYHMLNELLIDLKKEGNRFHLGRNSERGLAELKELGDKSAHNRRFNATQADIDRVRADVRTAVEELTHMAGFAA